MKIGRNSPCPCGSGKKYKNCCLGQDGGPSQSLYYQRLSEAHNRLVERLSLHAKRTFGIEAVGVAMDEFFLWPEPEDEIDEKSKARALPLFWPWFLFNWEYDAYEADVELSGPEDQTVAELYAEERGGRLDPLERKLIDTINRKPYSFLEVLRVDRGQGLRLKDVLKGDEIEVLERTGSEYVQPGDLLYGRAVSIDGVGMIFGLGPTIIPPGRKPEVIALRQRLNTVQTPISDDTLFDWDAEIREAYLSIEAALYSPPKLCNTDGHPLEFHRLVYQVSSADEAFEKLCGLCVTEGAEKLRATAQQDDAGRIIRVEFSWNRHGHKASHGMSNTVLGRLVINGLRLTAEVNSAQRAKALRRKIASRMGAGAKFKLDKIQDIDSMLRKHSEGVAAKRHSTAPDDPMQHPEVQKQLEKMILKHWEGWVDDNIPALEGKTPKEAVMSADGREGLEALLRDAERDRGQDPITLNANRKGVQRVRELLGLEDLKG